MGSGWSHARRDGLSARAGSSRGLPHHSGERGCSRRRGPWHAGSLQQAPRRSWRHTTGPHPCARAHPCHRARCRLPRRCLCRRCRSCGSSPFCHIRINHPPFCDLSHVTITIAPTVTRTAPTTPRAVSCSRRRTTASTRVMTSESLSIGTTRDACPNCRAR